MIFELVDAMEDITAIYFWFSEGKYVKKPKGEKGRDCVGALSRAAGYLRKIRGASSIVEEMDSWSEKLDKKYSVGDKIDEGDGKKLGKTSWEWVLKVRRIAIEFDKEWRTLESLEERMKNVQKTVEERMGSAQKGFEPILHDIKQYMSRIQNASLAFVESSPTERSLEPKLRGLLNTANSGELMLTGYFDQYLLKVFQTLTPKPAIKFISPELTSSKSDKVNLDALERLGKIGAEVRVHPMLHARMALSPTEIIAGSADIKSDCLGGRRYDAGIWSNNPILVRSGKDFFNKVWNESKPL